MSDAELLLDVLAIIAIVLLVAAFLRWRFPKRRVMHGSARWLTVFEAVRLRLFWPW